MFCYIRSQGSSASVMTKLWATGVQLLPGEIKGVSLLPPHPDQLWGPPGLLSNGYW